jgi:hypothetical protein
MSLTGFMADAQAVVHNGPSPGLKVFGDIGILPVWVHRLKTCATNGGPPH